jgi:hypothetical protein
VLFKTALPDNRPRYVVFECWVQKKAKVRPCSRLGPRENMAKSQKKSEKLLRANRHLGLEEKRTMMAFCNAEHHTKTGRK